MGVVIKAGNSADVDAVVDVGRRTWPQTYTPLAGEDYVRMGLDKWWTVAATRPLVLAGKATVAELDGEVVGVAVVGPLTGDLVLFRLYVVPEHQGMGIGRLLLEDVMTTARETGHRILRLSYLNGTPAPSASTRLRLRRVPSGTDRGRHTRLNLGRARPVGAGAVTPPPSDPAVAARLAQVEAEIMGRAPEHDLVPTLDRVAAVMELLGDPQRSFRVIHLTGTNGKTSTTRMIEALCREHGLRTGRFTSPHLHSMRERIAVDGEPVSAEVLVETWDEVAPIIEIVEHSAAEGGPG